MVCIQLWGHIMETHACIHFNCTLTQSNYRNVLPTEDLACYLFYDVTHTISGPYLTFLRGGGGSYKYHAKPVQKV